MTEPMSNSISQTRTRRDPAVIHYHWVDLLRGIAALAVLVCHYRWFYAIGLGDWRTDVQLPLYSILWPFYEHGGIAVQLFWCLSGFVFAVAYDEKHVVARDFWIHRIARLYPLHLATLLIITGLESVSLGLYGRLTIEPNFDFQHFLAHLFFASNWFTMEPSFNGPIWSVSVEVLIYFAFLAYLLLVRPKRLTAIGLSLIGMAIAVATGNPIAQCLGLFFVGVTLATIRDGLSFWMTAAIAAMLILLAIAMSLVGEGRHVHTLMVYVGGPIAIALFAAADARTTLPRRFRWIGLSTYSIYLLHMPVIIFFRVVFGNALTPFLPNPLSLLLYCSVVVGLAVPCYRRFELPAREWIRARFARDVMVKSKP